MMDSRQIFRNQISFDAASFDRDGFARDALVLDADSCDTLAATFDEMKGAGVRHLIHHAKVRALLKHSKVAELLCGVLGGNTFAYKATLFDKSTDSNWLLAWHQDVSIPVRQQRDLAGWTGWSRKEGVLYVQPPTDVLSRLVALRINLDDCCNNNGPLRLLVGSHRLGRVNHSEVASHTSGHIEQTITGARGSGMLMRPLLIHASSKAVAIARRRVLHLEFANFELPDGMDWAQQNT